MTQDQEVVLMIRGAIASLSPAEQSQTKLCYDALRKLETDYPDYAPIAIALRAAEMAAE